MIDYSIYTVATLGIAYLAYIFLLKRQRSFVFNRLYLIISLLVCLTAPLIEFNFPNEIPIVSSISYNVLVEQNNLITEVQDLVINETDAPLESSYSIVWMVYIIITTVLCLRLLFNLSSLVKNVKKDFSPYKNLRLIVTSNPIQTSSFFNLVFISNTDSKDTTILEHERLHFEGLHSIDILLVELILCIFWFNPFIWLYRKCISENHEFIVDEKMVQMGNDLDTYSSSIISTSYKLSHYNLTSAFKSSQIKNRISMLHQSKQSMKRKISRALISTVIVSLLFLASSFSIITDQTVVVIDIGHGGADTGHVENGLVEKDVLLKIGKYLESMSNKKIKILTTRSADNYITLTERIKFINSVDPDLFISLHLSGNNEDAYLLRGHYFESENFDIYNKSMASSSLVSSKLLGVGYNKISLFPGSFKILKDTKVPGFMLELGPRLDDLDNHNVSSNKKQQEIAQAIFDGIIRFSENDY